MFQVTLSRGSLGLVCGPLMTTPGHQDFKKAGELKKKARSWVGTRSEARVARTLGGISHVEVSYIDLV